MKKLTWVCIATLQAALMSSSPVFSADECARNCGSPITGGATQAAPVVLYRTEGVTFDPDDDFDGDGALDYGENKDNCPFVANGYEDGDLAQANSDGDSHGDKCDNCPMVTNEDQSNIDGDPLGDACDDNIDEDDLGNAPVDNCEFHDNDDQLNTDAALTGGDSLGDACDDDDDADAVPDDLDNCEKTQNADQLNSDGFMVGDSQGNACEDDFDNDGYPDPQDPNNPQEGEDLCPKIKSTKNEASVCEGLV